MKNQTNDKEHIKTDLIRGLFMLLFLLIAEIIRMCVLLIAVFQLLISLIAQKTNDSAKRFGMGLSYYLAEIVLYLSYNTEVKPWPFSPWPHKESLEPKSKDSVEPKSKDSVKPKPKKK